MRDTFVNAFDDKNMVATIEFQSHLSSLSKNIIFKTKAELLIKHTLFPLYKPFLFKNQQLDIEQMMYENGGMGIKGKIGFLAGSVCKKDNLYYCPVCVEDDLVKYEETYFRVLHQMQGTNVCEKHHVKILPYAVKQSDVSRLKFISLNEEQIINKSHELGNELEIDISDMFEKIYHGCINDYSAMELKKLYRKKLKDRGYMTVNDNAKYKTLIPDIINYFGEDVLKAYGSELEANFEFSWIRLAIRTKKVKIHPLRHLLLILFLFGSIEEMIEFDNQKLAQEKYPCMNPICGHYKKLFIEEKDTITTADYKSRVPVITIECHICKFRYSRKVSDDIYSVGRIKVFGEIWLNELKSIKNDNSMSLRAKARYMGCDPATIKKYGDI